MIARSRAYRQIISHLRQPLVPFCGRAAPTSCSDGQWHHARYGVAGTFPYRTYDSLVLKAVRALQPEHPQAGCRHHPRGGPSFVPLWGRTVLGLRGLGGGVLASYASCLTWPCLEYHRPPSPPKGPQGRKIAVQGATSSRFASAPDVVAVAPMYRLAATTLPSSTG